MANYNKSFNFRNGVQVDDDDLIVRSSLVGIGTTIPRADLDVNGAVQVAGIITTRGIYAGIATFANVQIGTGITIDGNAGIITATFVGNGAGLYNIPTSQWVDVNPDIFQYTSIYAAGNVGIGTTYPLYTLQIGGIGLSTNRFVGFNSTGDIYATGILTSGSFVGSGAGVTSLNASNISSGTLSNDRLPSTIAVGLVSATNFTAGIATVGFLTATSGYIGILTVNYADVTDLSVGVGTITDLTAIDASITNIVAGEIYSGITTSTLLDVGIGTATSFAVNNPSSTAVLTVGQDIDGSGVDHLGFYYNNVAGPSGVGGEANIFTSNGDIKLSVNDGVSSITFGNNVTDYVTINGSNGTVTVAGLVTASQLYVGFATALSLNSNNSVLGVATATNLVSASIRVGKTSTNKIDTSSGNLVLDSTDGQVQIDDHLSVVGVTTFDSVVNVNTGILPDSDLDAYLGSNTKYFSSAYVGAIQIGAAATNVITTRDGDLRLDSNTNNVVINANATVDNNLVVTGTSNLSGIATIGEGILPDSDQGAYLGSSSLRFSESYVDNITIGVGSDNRISTLSGNLSLNANSGLVDVQDRLSVTGTSVFSGIITAASNIVPSSDRTGEVGLSNKAFNSAHIGELRVGVAGSTVLDTRLGDLILDSVTNRVLVDQDLRVGNTLFVTSDTVLGSNNVLSVLNGSSFVGIGTSVPTSDLQIRKSGNVVLEVISDTGEPTISIGQSVGLGQSSAQFRYDAASKSLEIVNNAIGNVSNYIHAGTAGVGTGNFNWIYGQNNNELMNLTHTGMLGIGITNPSRTLHVVGTSTVTDTGYFGNDLYVKGTIYLNDDPLGGVDSILTTNIFAAAGVSTVKELHVHVDGATGISSIGIGTDKPKVGLDAQTATALFDKIGIATDAIPNGVDIYAIGFVHIENDVGIGTTVLFDPNADGLLGSVQLHNKTLGLFDSSLIVNGEALVGVATYYPRSYLDFGNVGTSSSISYMIVPSVSTGSRDGFRSITNNGVGVGSTVAGAIIFNTTTLKHQGYDGTTWHDLY